MPKLYMVTVPGLDVKSDWLPVHDLLLDEFPDVTEVLATTIPETLLIVYRGRADIEAWLTGLDEAVSVRTSARFAVPRRQPSWTARPIPRLNNLNRQKGTKHEQPKRSPEPAGWPTTSGSKGRP
jgi:hypothetical protein